VALTVQIDPLRDQQQASKDALAQPHWYATYTCANHEKRVAARLDAMTIEHFLPLYRSVRRWKDRRVSLDLPLFPGYVFVRVAISNQLQVLQVPSVVHLVGFGGYPLALPDDEMAILRTGLAQQLRAEPHPFLTAGRRVRIRSGPLAGLEGIFLRRKGGHRVVVSIEMIQRSISVDADVSDLEPRSTRKIVPRPLLDKIRNER
jgi:transcription antitermination factor NusG